MLTKEQSKALSAIRIPLILMVVMIHILPARFEQIQSIYHVISEGISHNLCQITVPCFFFLSGYFFFLNTKGWNIKVFHRKIIQRAQTLLIPYILWNIIHVVTELIRQIVQNHVMPSVSWWYNLWTGPIDYPLWYVRDLMCMVVICPIFFLIATKLPRLASLTLYIGLWLTYPLLNFSMPIGLSITAISFFGLGSVFALQHIDLFQILSRHKLSLLILNITLLIIATYYNAHAVHPILISCLCITGGLGMIHAAQWLCTHPRVTESLNRWSKYIFFVFACHAVHIINMVIARFALIEGDGIVKILCYFSIPITTIAICIFMYHVLLRFTPRILKLLTGGRI